MPAQYVGHAYGTSGTLDFSALVADGDALILHVRKATHSPGPVLPAGWVSVLQSAGIPFLVGYRTWQTGDPTTQPVQDTHTAVAVYRSIDVDWRDGAVGVDAPVVSRTAGGFATIVNPDDLAVDFATHYSSSSFTFEAPPGDELRHGTSVGGAGIALADTAGQTLTPTTTWKGVFTQGGGAPLPGTNYLATVVLKAISALVGGGWGVGAIRMGAN